MFHPRDSAPITCRAPAIIQSKERFASALLTWFATRRQNICGILGLLRLAINIFPCTYSPAHIPLPVCGRHRWYRSWTQKWCRLDRNLHSRGTIGTSTFVSFEEEGRVGAPKTEGIREGIANGHSARLVWHVVEITVRIRRLVVDGGRNDAPLDNERSDSRFDGASRAQQVSDHRFRRADGELVRVFAKE